MIISKTPYRLSFFGGGTDFVDWYKENESIVISAAMNYHCYISVKRQVGFFDYKSRVAYSNIELVKDNKDIKHPSVRECLKYFRFENGLDIHHVGELPAQSGIGSSSSFTVGLLNAIHALQNIPVSKSTLAEEAIYVEQEMINEAVGVQDQITAAYGGINVIKLGPGKRRTVKKIPLSFAYKEYIKRSILLGYTGQARDGLSLMKKHKGNISSGLSTHLLIEINSTTEEAYKLFEKEEDIDKIGKLLKHSWEIKRQFVSDIESERFNQIYEIALKNGAFGGKLMGAGAQGFFYFLAHPSKHGKIKEKLPGVKVWVPMHLSEKGSTILKISR